MATEQRDKLAWAIMGLAVWVSRGSKEETMSRVHEELSDALTMLERAPISEVKYDIIRQELVDCGYNISEVAKKLGISRGTIYRALDKQVRDRARTN